MLNFQKFAFPATFLLIQIAYFSYSFYVINTEPDLSQIRKILGPTLAIARASANLINFNCAFILIPICRNLISYLRTTFINRLIQIDHHLSFHKLIASCIVFWSIVHVIAHLFNYLYISTTTPISTMFLLFASGPGSTGLIISICLFLMVTCSMQYTIRKSFELFWLIHHLFIVFFGATLIHGSFCFIKSNNNAIDKCRGGPTFWKWWLAGFTLYIIERILREVRGNQKTEIIKVISHPSKVVEIRFKKQSLKYIPGQYVFLCVPEISAYEWHPFTLTSSPDQEESSIHMRIAGDWTGKLAKRLGYSETITLYQVKLPLLMVDGAYGSASEDCFEYPVALLIGAGIGVTPFASILKSIRHRLTLKDGLKKLAKVYLVWIAREIESFEWFNSLLNEIENDPDPRLSSLISISTYITSRVDLECVHNIYLQDTVEMDALTGLKSKTNFGRPNFNHLFQRIKDAHRGADVGVFVCGPETLTKVCKKYCNDFSSSNVKEARFYYGKENF